jgi:hypothetical protein
LSVHPGMSVAVYTVRCVNGLPCFDVYLGTQLMRPWLLMTTTAAGQFVGNDEHPEFELGLFALGALNADEEHEILLCVQ